MLDKTGQTRETMTGGYKRSYVIDAFIPSPLQAIFLDSVLFDTKHLSLQLSSKHTLG